MAAKKEIKYPIGIHWNCSETSLQRFRQVPISMSSSSFYIAGMNVSYNMEIQKVGNNWYIAFELSPREKVKVIKAEYTISIESANFSSKNVYNESSKNRASAITVEELFNPENQYIVDGEMDVKLDGFVIIEMEVPQMNKIGDSLGIILWNQDNHDFDIVVKREKIKAHKFILASLSPVFKAMFKPHTKEAKENKVEIKDFSFSVVEAAIRLCYHHSLVDETPLEDQMSLLQFFEKYDIASLKTDLENYMISEINESNVCRFTNCAIDLNSPKLRKKCIEFLRGCFNNKSISDLAILNKDFAWELFENAFSGLSKS